MPFRQFGAQQTNYALLAFDGDGVERNDDADGDAGRLSPRILEQLTADPAITDLFVFAHGWNGDVADAIDQYDRWFGALEARAADKQAAAARRPGFKPYRIGLHWPSKPWGDEELGGGAAAFAVGDPVALYAKRLGDRPGLREAVAAVFRAAAAQPDAQRLPDEAERTYRAIDALLVEMRADGAGAAPGCDRDPFDPQACFQALRQDASFGLGDIAQNLLAPLRVLSFWKMKQRANVVGATGAHDFCHDAQRALAGRDVRIHFMGHSFGSIFVSSAILGPPAGTPLAPVSSLALVQGAMSLWSMCGDIPTNPGQSGYFRRIVDERRVAGATITTRSRFDSANRRFYPIGAGVAGEVAFDVGAPPRYGAVGSFGLQGQAPQATDLKMRAADEDYGFAAGTIYNLEASAFICKGGGLSGAHSDIDGPEVAHAIWQAALSA